jgi:hypothetical protein
VVIHETLDSRTVSVEFELAGEIRVTGEKYVVPYIEALKVTNGEIEFLHNYFSGESLHAIYH